MNPPSALYGAMNKERKPFTYTPGGLDLSEIKSERMAQRLMRNAMSEGVPETPVHKIQSPPIATGIIPNFNCLPVQVFPTFQLPANPKSLLRTRSNTDAPKEQPSNNITPVSSLTKNKRNSDSFQEINKPSLEQFNNNNNISSNYKLASMYDYKPMSDNSYTLQPNYGSYGRTDILSTEKNYDAQYFQLEPQETITSKENILLCGNSNVYSDILKNPPDNQTNPEHLNATHLQDIASNNYEQKEVKIVKTQTKTGNEKDQNGDTEAEVIVKLPTKASAAKTETKVEVSKKTLPDGKIEEVKKTITKTTVDGNTKISTKTETRIIPKEIAEYVDELEEQEEETENVDFKENENSAVTKVNESIENADEIAEESDEEIIKKTTKTDIKENGHIITKNEKSESSTTKKVVVIQSTGEESEEEVEEEVEEEEEEETGDADVEEIVVLKKPPNKEEENVQVEENKENLNEDEPQDQDKQEQEQEEEEEEEEEEDDNKPMKVANEEENAEKDASDVEEEQISEEAVEEKEAENIVNEDSNTKEQNKEEVEDNYEEAEDSEKKVEVQEKLTETKLNGVSEELQVEKESKKEDNTILEQEAINIPVVREEELNQKQEITEDLLQKTTSTSEPKVSFREPSIPLEKVEDIEIKPIIPAKEIIKKSHTEIITKTTDQPSGALSTQTEYNRTENIVTVNRTTKTLDHAYEEIQPVPTLKTYFSPINDRRLSTPQPVSKPQAPVFTPEAQTERRHSLLLERLSVDRQVPPASDIYQNNYPSHQAYDQNQWLDEPQSEVLTVSNVKPSTITKNQQWYQQTKKENYTTNTVSPTPVLPSQIWNQQNQAQPQSQPQYQTYTQQSYTPKPEYQSTYVENNAQNIYKSNNNNIQQNSYPGYTPKPSWVSSTFESKPVSSTPTNQYFSLRKESTENYQKSAQQYNSSYVPPPWEQDSSYIAENQNYYQPPPNVSYTPSTNQSWKPKSPPSKFSKPAPTAYIPPAPNQSFVKPVAPEDTSKIAGRKTYYSEYERRYISVPESTYIPNETKFPAQPDPSPQYYYDNNEPVESVEPQWRKELREFTEKTSQTSVQFENTSVRPPWEEDPKYAAPTEYPSTVTPSWTQTLRPRSWRERSYEPEYVGSKEWPKTNTLGRGRPQSSYVKSNVNSIPERTRGVSVDRYNPNNYQSPLASEHPPVQSHTLNPTIHPKTYHNPTVPAYHARASVEPREQVTTYPQHRVRVESRAPPVQSRSFKYLQWITGTED
ncbi:probable serine/threonine-protein kinase kinX [Melitaea cinxia]|uniref:probable serine/threonine-protein kinase kinX n=1 Tax=Melitaea cinxia TaxID=113334 RepID=UPI001E272367|nr:probable serine/threonine-protein kinase kinX [Melitaea cinxia]